MKIMYLQIGFFNLAMLILLCFQNYGESKKFRDCMLFQRLLYSCVVITFIDTLGWYIDGNPLGGQIWFTTLVDGLDLFLTTLVCWCWVKYSLYVNNAEKSVTVSWYNKLENLLLVAQTILVTFSQYWGIYFYIDKQGVYQRGELFLVHTLISVGMLVYSSAICFRSYFHRSQGEKKSDDIFLALIILIPIFGNLFQQEYYGYPTIWLSMAFMMLGVYIHIQNGRRNAEREEKNRALQQALLDAEKANLAKTAFLSRMSHDMRTPLNGILGLTSFIKEKTTSPDTLEDLNELELSGKYLLSLINDTLDVGKIESGKLEIHNAVWSEEEMWQDIYKLSKSTAEVKQINFITHMEPDNLFLFTDRGRFIQIIMNLLSNAIKFTPANGTVEVTQQRQWSENGKTQEKITVRDTGIGMSQEFLPHIFEAFSQEDSSRTSSTSGTGLGMSIVKQLVTLMGGEISVESQLGQGTTFTVIMPFVLATEKQIQDMAEIKQATNDERILVGKTVLMCEDHPLNAKIAGRLLVAKGLNVDLAVNGQEGVNKFQQAPPRHYDAILMDIRMPVMDGLEAAKAIRKISRSDAKTIPIIAMTANAFSDDVLTARAAGMNAHISKPLDKTKFYETLIEQIALNQK